jgi:hypothetical protein
MNFALVIYTVVAMSGKNADLVQARDWRPVASFSNAELCNNAAHSMGISSDRYRCIQLTLLTSAAK